MNRPEAGNSMGLESTRALLAALREAEADPHTAVLTLTGAGRLFCGGGDVAAMAVHTPEARPAFLAELADAVHEVMLALASSRLVVLAAVNGAAAGAGLGLVLNADLVVASERAKFVAAYSSIGLTPDSGVSRLLPELVGHHRAMELLVTGRALSAEEAREWGLVNEVSAPEDFEACIARWESRLLRVPGPTLAQTKVLARHADDGAVSYQRHLAREAASIAEASGRDDAGALIERFATGG